MKSTHRTELAHTVSSAPSPRETEQFDNSANAEPDECPQVGPSRLELRKLADLRSFPDPLFDDLNEAQLRDLADDIERNGLRQNIETLPENSAGFDPDTILAGHQRIRALQLLGDVESEVLVRYDLADAPKEEIEKLFLDDNVNRRHLDPLARARVLVRRLELEQNRPRGDIDPTEDPEARDRVGKLLNMSGRNLSRYLRVLRTPRQVQDAFSNGELSLVVAEKVADLSQEQQSDIARRLDAGEAPKSVVAEYLPRRQRHRGHRAETSLKDGALGIFDRLNTTIGRLPSRTGKQLLSKLERARALLVEILEKLDRPR